MGNELKARDGFRFGKGVLSLAVATACAAGALAPAEAHAQEADTGAVSGSGKGIVGGALLGAEVVMMPMGIAGLEPWWPYLVFGGVGAVGGAVGGWAVEQNVDAAEAPVYMLAGGLALVIPTLVLTLNATTREEYEDESDPSTLTTSPDGQPGQAPPGAAPGAPAPDGGVTVQVTSDARRVRRRATPPMSVVDVRGGRVRVGIPAVQVRNMYSQEDVRRYGVEQKSEVHVPLVKATF